MQCLKCGAVNLIIKFILKVHSIDRGIRQITICRGCGRRSSHLNYRSETIAMFSSIINGDPGEPNWLGWNHTEKNRLRKVDEGWCASE